MNGDIDFSGQHVFFNFAGEQPLSTNFLQRAVKHLIAGGLDHNNFKGAFVEIKGLTKPWRVS